MAPAVLTLAVRPAHAKGPYNIENNPGGGPKDNNLSRSGAHGSSGEHSGWWQFWERM